MASMSIHTAALTVYVNSSTSYRPIYYNTVSMCTERDDLQEGMWVL